MHVYLFCLMETPMASHLIKSICIKAGLPVPHVATRLRLRDVDETDLSIDVDILLEPATGLVTVKTWDSHIWEGPLIEMMSLMRGAVSIRLCVPLAEGPLDGMLVTSTNAFDCNIEVQVPGYSYFTEWMQGQREMAATYIDV